MCEAGHAPWTTMTMTAQTQSTKADSDDEYLDDVVVRAALERIQRELDDHHYIESIHSERFADMFAEKTDYITVNLHEHAMGNGHRTAEIIQRLVDTGVVHIDEVNVEREYIRVAPTEA